MSDQVRKVDSLAWIDMALIHGNPNNPRRTVGDVTELAISIREQGLLQPIVVAPDDRAGGYVILAGHRRHAALVQLRAERALCLIRFPKNAPEAIALMLVENGQRVAVTAMEEARALQRLVDAGMSQSEIARRIGKSQTHVSMRLALLSLTPEEQRAVEDGDLLLRDARQTARVRRGTDKDTKYTGWHLGKTHPLAAAAADLCRSHDDTPPHTPARRLSATACGECWEHVIRADERTTQTRKEAS